MNAVEILRLHFDTFAQQFLRPTKGGAGTSVKEIKASFESFLRSIESPVTEVSSIQMGLMLKTKYIRRVTGTGAFYLVSIIQAS